MSLPKRDGVHDRYYLIHKPDTAPEVLAEADACIRSHGDRSCPLLQSPVNEDLFTIRILNEHRRNWS